MAAGLNKRRLRQGVLIRELVSDVDLSVSRLIQPLFAAEGLSAREAVPGLPGVFRETESTLLSQIENDLEQGVRKFILFGVPKEKQSKDFSHAYTTKIIQSIKRKFGTDLFLFVDVCLCSHTPSGHCGVLTPEGDHVENETTVAELAKASLAYAQAGADGVAPSDMMDGRIQAIRSTLLKSGSEKTVLMSYASKFHSGYYGPFRVAADSSPTKGGENSLKDRATYQIDPGNLSDAIACGERDWNEGADILLVKPGLPSLDVIVRLGDLIPNAPIFAYEVSGEYAAVEALAEKGLMDAKRVHLENWTALHRAGAKSIITYGARNAKDWLKR